MTTDSECYRDWRYGSILNLNNYPYNNHNNEIIQKAYEQIYSQQNKKSNSSLNKDEIIIPVNDLFPISVVPYDFEPQQIHLFNNNQQLNTEIEIHQSNEQNLNKKFDKDKNFIKNKELIYQSNLNKKNKKDTLITVQDGKIKQKLMTTVIDINKDNLDRNMNLLTEN